MYCTFLVKGGSALMLMDATAAANLVAVHENIIWRGIEPPQVPASLTVISEWW